MTQEETRHLPREKARSLAPGSAHYSAYVGPAGQWDFMGATQFRLLTALGLREHHRLLDLGCGGPPSPSLDHHLTGAVLRDPEFLASQKVTT